eukprot:6785717-Prymnesium_polylepis.1
MGRKPPEHVTVVRILRPRRAALVVRRLELAAAGRLLLWSGWMDGWRERDVSARAYAGAGADALLDAQGAEREHPRDG